MHNLESTLGNGNIGLINEVQVGYFTKMRGAGEHWPKKDLLVERAFEYLPSHSLEWLSSYLSVMILPIATVVFPLTVNIDTKCYQCLLHLYTHS